LGVYGFLFVYFISFLGIFYYLQNKQILNKRGMMIDLNKLLELEANGTPGPWKLKEGYDCLFINFNCITQSDMNFIESMRNSIKELCTELQAAREVVEAARVGAFHHPACSYYVGEMSCGCSNQVVIMALLRYDETRRG
jgi:hypothetical protein